LGGYLVWSGFRFLATQVGALLASSEHPSSPPTLKVWDPAQSSVKELKLNRDCK